jgi:DNA mismatch repair protein MSH6
VKDEDSNSGSEYVLSNIDSFEDKEDDSGEYVPDAVAEKEILKQDQQDESEFKKKVKFESSNGAMEEESLPAKRTTSGNSLQNSGWGMFRKSTTAKKANPRTAGKSSKRPTKSGAKSAATTAGKATDLKKPIDLDNFDPLYFVGERDEKTGADMFNSDGGFNYDNFEKTTPAWARPQFRKDKNKRAPEDPNYDPTTLYIPKEEWKKFTPAIAQYWKIKQDNFEKVIFFKLGKFYEFMYEDAIIGNRELGIKFMGTKLHAGFPEAALDKYAEIMVDKGYTVGIVEQIETPQEFQIRKKNKSLMKEQWQKCQKRQMVKVLTKGTYCNHNTIGYQPRYLFSIYTGLKSLNFTIVDITLGCIICGVFEKDI